MPDEIRGLPTHILLVHAVVILLPLCCLLLVAAATLPQVRARLGLALPVLAGFCVVLVPLTTSAGEDLKRQVGAGALVERHADLGRGVLKWAIAVLVLAAVVWWVGRRDTGPVRAADPDAGVLSRASGGAQQALVLRIALTVLCLAVAAGTVVQVVRTGESGSKAVWQGVTQQ